MVNYTLTDIKALPYTDDDSQDTNYTLSGTFDIFNTDTQQALTGITKRIGVFNPRKLEITYDNIECPKEFKGSQELISTDREHNPMVLKEIVDIAFYYYMKSIVDLNNKLADITSTIKSIKIDAEKHYKTPLYNRNEKTPNIRPFKTISEHLNKLLDTTSQNSNKIVIRLYSVVFDKFCDRDADLFAKIIDGEYEIIPNGYKFRNNFYPNGFSITR